MTKTDVTLNLILITYIQLIDQDWLFVIYTHLICFVYDIHVIATIVLDNTLYAILSFLFNIDNIDCCLVRLNYNELA